MATQIAQSCRSGLLHTHAGLLAALLSLCLNVPVAFAVNKAVIIGPTYPGGAQFDDTIANDRANAIGASLAKWGNWNAADINVLPGGVGCAGIANAIAAAAPGLQANDYFLFIYHGHGSFVHDDELTPPALDTCDESIWPSAHCLDDTLAANLSALPAASRKIVILASCYSGGFWNGSDPTGDLEMVPNLCLMAGCSECECLPEPSVFVNNLLAKIDPTGWPGVASVSIQQFSQALMTGASGSVINGQRWGETLPKCPCEGEDPVAALCDFDFTPEFKYDPEMSSSLQDALLVQAEGACHIPNSGCQVLTEADCTAAGGTYEGDGTICTGEIPTVSEWGMIIMTLLMLTVATLAIGRRRRATQQKAAQ